MAPLRYKLDKEADALYVRLSDEPYSFGEDIDKERRIDYDRERRPRGIEFTAVSEGVDLRDLPRKRDLAALMAELRIRVYA